MVFKKFTTTDYEYYHQVLSFDTVMKNVTGKAVDDMEIKRAFDDVIANGLLHEQCGFFKILWQGKFVGYVKLKLKNAKSTDAEIAYFLLPKYWGIGLASMALKKLIDIAKTTHIKQLFATVNKQNAVSKHILKKHGFIYQHDEMIGDIDGEYWQLTF